MIIENVTDRFSVGEKTGLPLLLACLRECLLTHRWNEASHAVEMMCLYPTQQYEDYVWKVRRTGEDWAEPQRTGLSAVGGISVAGNGTIYYMGRFEGSLGGRDIYRSRWVDGRYAERENLGEPINTEFNEGDTYIAADESCLAFASHRPGGSGEGDLYVSFR